MPLIGVINDGKPGHLNQSLGLADALQRQREGVDVHVVDALPSFSALSLALSTKNRDYPIPASGNPRLYIGAGHATHMSLLALGRQARCPSVVLMRPSLPRLFFDLCIEPRHDGGVETDRVWLSDGALNRMQPDDRRDIHGVILLGGPSAHFAWRSDTILGQIEKVCSDGEAWQLTGSRRTPPELLGELAALDIPRLSVHAADALPKDWLSATLPRARLCWVSPDSASMVYEALTAGAAVGVFDLKATAGSRVARGVGDLCARRMITPFSEYASLEVPCDDKPRLAEADRIARRILERGWL